MPLPPEFWEQERQRLLAVLLPLVEKAAISGVAVGTDQMQAVLGIGFDNALANAQAAAWARQHTDDLLNMFGTTNQRVVGEIVASWTETPGATLGQLSERLAQVLDANASRAGNIAVTEVTRAYSEGSAAGYQAAGVEPPIFKPPAHPRCRCWHAVARLARGVYVVVWRANNDELMCTHDITTPWGTVSGCRDLNNRIISAGPYLGMKFADAQREAGRG